ncbi:MAG: chorismate mutase [Iodobacter sp.]
MKLLLACGLIFFSTTAISAPDSDIAALLNQRLSYMKDVAGYKASHHLPIEDLQQETRVLADSSGLAEKSGLNGYSVQPFIQIQMDVAKAIQYRYRADWLSVPENNWQPEPLAQVRAKISALNASIQLAVSARLRKGEPFTDKAAFIGMLQHPQLKESDKERLWYGLTQITLNQQ